MDTFENNEFHEPEEEQAVPSVEDTAAEEPAAKQPEPAAKPAAYRGAGAGRKESPYADSPYVMNRQPQEEPYRYQPQTEPPEKPKKEIKSRMPMGRKIIAIAAALALAAGSCLITAASINEYWEDRTEDMTEAFTRQINSLQEQIDSISENSGRIFAEDILASGGTLTPAQVYAQNVNSVVAISTTIQTSLYGQAVEGSSSGSGFVLSEDGYVITNYHVVENASAVEVITHDGTEYAAQIVGYDSTNDLAVLKIDAAGLSAATVGSSSDLIIGDMVVAIGNPLGELTSTQTVGYVSGINREVTTDNTIISMIQTDAAINPGNSGGPLFNMRGEVVGITTAKYSGTTSSGASIEGIGFAVPIDDVMTSISDLIDYGYITGAYMGITVQNIDASSASLYGLPTEGAYVVSVEDGYSAQRAGIQPKDIIIDLGGTEIDSITTLTRALRNYKAGDTTTVTVVRSGAELTLEITLDEKPHDTSVTVPGSDASVPSEGDYEEWYEYFRRYFGE